MKLIIYIDGAARGNPGPAGVGVIIYDESGRVLEKHNRYLGETTNNCAEYEALLDALKLALKHNPSSFILYTDSELLFKQMEGSYRVRNEKLAGYFKSAKELLGNFEKYEFFHVKREKNKQADQLANIAVDLGLSLKV